MDYFAIPVFGIVVCLVSFQGGMIGRELLRGQPYLGAVLGVFASLVGNAVLIVLYFLAFDALHHRNLDGFPSINVLTVDAIEAAALYGLVVAATYLARRMSASRLRSLTAAFILSLPIALVGVGLMLFTVTAYCVASDTDADPCGWHADER